MKKSLLILIVAICGIANAQNTCAPLITSGLVGYYPFCGNANDASGNANNGTVNGATLTADRFGNANSAYSFNGTSDYIDVPSGNATSLNISGDFSLSFWIKTSQGSNHIISFGDVINSNSGGYLAGLNDGSAPLGQLGFSAQGIWHSSTITLNDNSWHNLIVTLDSDTIRLYIDNSLNVQATGTLPPLSWNGARRIGVRNDFFNGWYQGIIDDVSIYNRALTPAEVTQIYSTSSNCLIAQYNFTGNAVDSSGNGLNGTVYGATLASDRFGNLNSSYHFNGSSDYIEVIDNPLLGFSSNQMSVSYWVKIESYSTNSSYNKLVISKQSGSGSSQIGFNVWYTSGDGGLRIRDGISGNFGGASIGSSSNLNQWYHIVYTWDGTTGIGYVDGVLVNSEASTNTVIGTNSLSLLIGKANWSNINAEPFHGWIDDINIYNCAITQQEIDSLFNAGSVGVEEIETNILKTYPNPTTNILNIANGQGNYIITDVFGRIVKEVNITTDKFKLNTNGFKSGVYFLISKEDNSSIKFIKQ